MAADQKHTILIVDDTPDNIRILMDFLRDDYTLVVATNGERALEIACSAHTPDLILLDIIMPGMDGYEVCRRLKADEHTAKIPVIFVTGLSNEVDEQKGLALGAVDYISKPFSPSRVRARVRNHLDLKQHRDHLEELVALRTAELAALNTNLENRVLEEVKKNSEKDHLIFHQARLAAMGEMLRNISHQWRQPLNNVALLIQCAQSDFDDGRLDKTSFQNIVTSCMKDLNYLSGTINNFATFFKQEQEERYFDPCRMIEQSLTLVKEVMESHNIKLSMTTEGSGMCHGYCNEFSQSVLNIVTNAIETHISRNIETPWITISCTFTESSIRITISDNAGGIAPDIIDKIFDPYFTTKFMSQGTGIGLYMTKTILENHVHGSCNVRNTDVGAEFTIILPPAVAPDI